MSLKIEEGEVLSWLSAGSLIQVLLSVPGSIISRNCPVSLGTLGGALCTPTPPLTRSSPRCLNLTPRSAKGGGRRLNPLTTSWSRSKKTRASTLQHRTLWEETEKIRVSYERKGGTADDLGSYQFFGLFPSNFMGLFDKKKYGKFDFILILRGEVCISSGLIPLIDKKKQKSKKLVHKSLNLQIIPNKIRNSLLKHLLIIYYFYLERTFFSLF